MRPAVFGFFNKISSFEKKQLFLDPPGTLFVIIFLKRLACANFKEEEHFNFRPNIHNQLIKINRFMKRHNKLDFLNLI